MKDTQKVQIKEMVDRALGRRLENKFVGWSIEDCVNHNSAISAPDCVPIVQQIAQLNQITAGDSSATAREGDRINPKSLTVRGVLSLKTESQTDVKNLLVRVMILAQKDIKVGAQVSAGAVDTARLLKPGYTTGPGDDQTQFLGLTNNVYEPVNRDLFRVYYDKVFKLCPATNATVENTRQVVQWSYRFKQLPSALTYDEGNGNWANNFAPFLAIGYSYADCTEPDTIITKVKSTVSSFLSFEDA